MSTYTVKRGDNLWAIAQRHNIKGGWQTLYNWNKGVVGGNPNLIYAGQKLVTQDPAKVAPPAPPRPAPAPTKSPIKDLVDVIPKKPERQSFTDRYGTKEEWYPMAEFEQFAAQQVNPEIMRMAVQQQKDLDKHLGQTGAWRSGYGQSANRDMWFDLDKQKTGMMKEYMGDQKDRVAQHYDQQMASYGKSEDPNWVLQQLGDDRVLGGGYKAGRQAGPKRTYHDDVNLRQYFQPGGYGQVDYNKLYGNIR